MNVYHRRGLCEGAPSARFMRETEEGQCASQVRCSPNTYSDHTLAAELGWWQLRYRHEKVLAKHLLNLEYYIQNDAQQQAFDAYILQKNGGVSVWDNGSSTNYRLFNNYQLALTDPRVKLPEPTFPDFWKKRINRAIANYLAIFPFNDAQEEKVNVQPSFYAASVPVPGLVASKLFPGRLTASAGGKTFAVDFRTNGDPSSVYPEEVMSAVKRDCARRSRFKLLAAVMPVMAWGTSQLKSDAWRFECTSNVEFPLLQRSGRWSNWATFQVVHDPPENPASVEKAVDKRLQSIKDLCKGKQEDCKKQYAFEIDTLEFRRDQAKRMQAALRDVGATYEQIYGSSPVPGSIGFPAITHNKYWSSSQRLLNWDILGNAWRSYENGGGRNGYDTVSFPFHVRSFYTINEKNQIIPEGVFREWIDLFAPPRASDRFELFKALDSLVAVSPKITRPIGRDAKPPTSASSQVKQGTAAPLVEQKITAKSKAGSGRLIAGAVLAAAAAGAAVYVVRKRRQGK